MRTQTDISGEWKGDQPREPRGLRLVETPGQGAVDLRFPAEGSLLLGRDPGPSGIAIQDTRMSSVHLEVQPGDDNRLWFRDMGSKNGSYHNGRRSSGGPLDDGDVLRVGSTLLVVTRRGPAAELEDPGGGLVGQSPGFREALVRAELATRSDAPALVLGETGVGKEGMARMIHRASGRRGPIVTVNCAVLSATMAGAALFGHEKGAFTGAAVARKGFFREAEGGTLFLDEIGDLPDDVQAHLLRALEQGEVTPVGASRPLKVDVRVVAATHSNLRERASRGAFRRDLFARLDGWSITIPPLRERREDILRLARFFAGRPPARVPYGQPMFEPGLAEVLLLYDWPYNVRELKQVLERLLVQSKPPFKLELLPQTLVAAAMERTPSERREGQSAPKVVMVSGPQSPRRRSRPSRDELLAALDEHGFNIAAVARALSRDRKQIYRWLESYGIELSSD